jgi:hypothetical protein
MKKPIELDKYHVSTHSAEVGQPAEKAVNPSSTEEVQDVPEDPNVVDVVDGDDSGQMTSHPSRIQYQNQPGNSINPRLPKPR